MLEFIEGGDLKTLLRRYMYIGLKLVIVFFYEVLNLLVACLLSYDQCGDFTILYNEKEFPSLKIRFSEIETNLDLEKESLDLDGEFNFRGSNCSGTLFKVA